MRKILLLLLTVLTFTSCTKSYRNDDVFVIISKEKKDTYFSETYDLQYIRDVQYKYLYHARHYATYTKNAPYYLGDCVFVSNENYELGDTIKFNHYGN